MGELFDAELYDVEFAGAPDASCISISGLSSDSESDSESASDGGDRIEFLGGIHLAAGIVRRVDQDESGVFVDHGSKRIDVELKSLQAWIA